MIALARFLGLILFATQPTSMAADFDSIYRAKAIPICQDQSTDAAELYDVIDPPSTGGDLVVRSFDQTWDDGYDVPLVNRSSSMERFGGWNEYVARQAAYLRKGVR